ncbi:MAG TPA: hypothetical protein VMU10_00380 [Desulfomonilia bacterium]|nr:hypothetical protein [Desulfomonilia bacterium]
MKHTRIRYISTSILVVACLLAATTYVHAATGRQLAESALSSLRSSAATTTTQNMTTLSWSWFEINYYDEQYPLTVDLVGSNLQCAQKIIYLLPGGGVNFKSSFLTPFLGDNLAQYLRKNGYLVVGITPREDNVPSADSYPFMAGWGLAKHKADMRKIISIVQAKVHLPYCVLGHSFGAAYALDYAASYPNEPEKTIALDIYSFAPGDTVRVHDADITYGAFLDLMGDKQYADSSYSDIKSLMLISLLFPWVDSGQSRSDLSLPGDFTFEGLLYYSMIWSSTLPGIHTPLTGLPGDWPLVQSYVAGQYILAQNPWNDTYSFSKTDICTLREAAVKVGSGLVPCALYRDYFAVNAFNGAYTINFSAITKPVLWLNTELGYGTSAYHADNPNVEAGIILGYGHLDALSSNTAQQDVWHRFIE